jgi:DNA ligase (NAD+)
LRRADPSEVARYPLQFFPWSAPQCEGVEFATQREISQALRDFGFADVALAASVRGIEAVIAYRDELMKKRTELPYEIDGAVAKLDRLDLRERLGQTARSTRWQLAYKFPSSEATSILRAIEILIGINGRLTPRAHLDPVEIGGVIVRHATLHNVEHVKRLGVKVGDRVFIYRAGDVIPHILGVAEAAQGPEPRDWRAKIPEELSSDLERRPDVTWEWCASFAMPERCPSCGSQVVQDGAYFRCPNGYRCLPQVVGRTAVLLAGFEIDDLGEKKIAQLVEHGLLRTPADVFHLDREKLLEIERWGEKTVANLFGQIETKRTVPFERFLIALAIPEVGAATARLLAQHFHSFEALRESSLEELQLVHGIGPEMARTVREWFDEAQNGAFVERLFAGGVVIRYPDPSSASGPLAGKTLVFTGTLPTLSRAEAKSLAESAGARVASAVSAKTDYLVAGEDAGSKAKKAAALGTQVIDEARFIALARK